MFTDFLLFIVFVQLVVVDAALAARAVSHITAISRKLYEFNIPAKQIRTENMLAVSWFHVWRLSW